MKSTFWRIILLLAATAVLTAAVLVGTKPKKDFLEERVTLAVRQIGHHLLLHAGDSSSRILPVKQPAENIFELEFQHRFSFVPDSLVAIVQRNLASVGLPPNYRVSVFDCFTHEMVYGFEILSDSRGLIPCLGRVQPPQCYRVMIAFLEEEENFTIPASVYVVSFAGLVGVILLVSTGSIFKKRRRQVDTPAAPGIAIGMFVFHEQQQVLTTSSETIQLSYKEARLLRILAANLNALTERDHLLKEVWENEGVITGRSLDMFVSKLRKKLSEDPSVRITNVHGRGYKLEVVPDDLPR